MAEHERQRTQIAELLVPVDPATAFELFEPIGERRWAHDWEPRFIHPPSGRTQTGAVFTRDHDGRHSLWTIAEYEPNEHRIVYVVFVPGERVTRIAIDCRADGTATRARVTYTHTALSGEGEQLVAHFTAERHQRLMGAWQDAIEQYLARAQRRKEEPAAG